MGASVDLQRQQKQFQRCITDNVQTAPHCHDGAEQKEVHERQQRRVGDASEQKQAHNEGQTSADRQSNAPCLYHGVDGRVQFVPLHVKHTVSFAE